MKEFEKEPVLVRLADMETRFLWQQFRLNDGKGKKYVETQSLLQQKYTVVRAQTNAFAMRMEKNANFMSYLQWKKWLNFLINSSKEKDELKRIIMDQKK